MTTPRRSPRRSFGHDVKLHVAGAKFESAPSWRLDLRRDPLIPALVLASLLSVVLIAA